MKNTATGVMKVIIRVMINATDVSQSQIQDSYTNECRVIL